MFDKFKSKRVWLNEKLYKPKNFKVSSSNTSYIDMQDYYDEKYAKQEKELFGTSTTKITEDNKMKEKNKLNHDYKEYDNNVSKMFFSIKKEEEKELLKKSIEEGIKNDENWWKSFEEKMKKEEESCVVKKTPGWGSIPFGC